MEQEHDAGRRNDQGGNTTRNWAERFIGPVRYRRFTATGVGNKRCVFFKVEIPPGHPDVETAVYEVFNGAKKLPHLSSGSGYQSTGLYFSRDPTHGRVWRLPDNPLGRTAADVIQARLDDLAEELSSENKRTR